MGHLTSINWSNTIEPQLDGYSAAEIADVNDYIDAGYSVHLPESADLTVDDWTGTGFLATYADASCIAVSHIISGGYSGGAAATNAALSPSTVFDNAYGAEHGRRGDGAYGFGSTDLRIGSLSFSRQYSSRRRFEDGPLGLGWTHSLDIQALVKSDSFQFLGVDSPIDAARQIVSFYVSWDMIEDQVLYGNGIAGICENWLMRQMTDQVVVIKQGTGTTTFVKNPPDPDDPNAPAYNPPPGQKLKLEVIDGDFRMKTSSGIFLDFDSDNDHRIKQWSDPFGNTIDYTYTSGKLTGVASKKDGTTVRSLTLTYTGDHITSITDSAGRSVSYEYDANDQMTKFWNLDSNDVTYGYESGEDGLISEIFSPIDPNLDNAVLTVVSDDLGRMTQQTDANGCTWDYYLATYRSEVVGPNQLDPNDDVKRFSTIRWANPATKKVTTTDQLDRTTTSEYDGQLRTTRILSAAGLSSEMDYDENSNVTKVQPSASRRGHDARTR